MSYKRTGGIDYDGFDWNEKLEIFTYKALYVTWEKKNSTFYYFFRLYLYFPDFFQVWKIAGQISGLFQEFKTLHEPWRSLVKSTLLSFYISPIHFATFVPFKYFYQLSVFDEISAF